MWIGYATDHIWLMLIGGLCFPLIPFALGLPAIVEMAREPHTGGYKDMSFIGGWMHVMGFSTKDIDDAFSKPEDRTEAE